MSASEQLAPQSGTPGRKPPAAVHTPATGTAQVQDMTEVRKPVLDGASLDSPGSSAPLTFANSVSSGGTGTAEEGADDGDESQRVSAYARLDFESFTFYVQTLQVILGRRAENGTNMVDVHLGPAKAISRRHAKIFYNFATQRFELTVIGRNGAFVGNVFVETGSTVPLWDSTRIQIGQIAFTFVLPSVPVQPTDGTPLGAAASQDYTDGGGSTATSSRAASGSPAPRRISEDLKLENGDENNLFAVTAARQASTEAVQPQPRRKPKREYRPEEIPPEFREKPPYSYSHLIAQALQERAPKSGLTLADIYEGIMSLFPYYRYCPPGWQNSVRHNLSSSRAFRKVSKEGKGWLWGLDEEYLAEKEQQKKRAAAKQARAQQHPHPLGSEKTIAELASEIPQRAQSVRSAGTTETDSSQKGLSDATVRLLATLQQKLQAELARAGQPSINRQLLTNSLAVVIAQAAKANGGIHNINQILQNPQAIQRLMVQALELMKAQAQAQGQPLAGPSAHNITQLASAAAVGTAGNHAGAVPLSDVKAEAEAEAETEAGAETEHPSMQSVKSEQLPQSIAPPAQGLAQGSEGKVSKQVAIQTPATPGTAPGVPVVPPAEGPAEGPTAPATPATSGTPQKPPMTREKIAQLLAQAEKIANPSPSILAAIEQLKAHQRAMDLKRPSDQPAPPAKRVMP